MRRWRDPGPPSPPALTPATGSRPTPSEGEWDPLPPGLQLSWGGSGVGEGWHRELGGENSGARSCQCLSFPTSGLGGSPGAPQPAPAGVELKGFGLAGPCCGVRVLLCLSPALLPPTSLRPVPAGGVLVGPHHPHLRPCSCWGPFLWQERSILRGEYGKSWGGLAGRRALGPPALTPSPPCPSCHPQPEPPGHWGGSSGYVPTLSCCIPLTTRDISTRSRLHHQ